MNTFEIEAAENCIRIYRGEKQIAFLTHSRLYIIDPCIEVPRNVIIFNAFPFRDCQIRGVICGGGYQIDLVHQENHATYTLVVFRPDGGIYIWRQSPESIEKIKPFFSLSKYSGFIGLTTCGNQWVI